MKAAIYSRKSVLSEKGESIENQVQLCESYGKNMGITEFTVYEDEGFSGKNTERPNFKRMMHDAVKDKFDVIICYRLDRISRNVSDFSSTIEVLNKHSIGFISIKEQFDTTTPMGRAMMYISSVFAQLERETIAERIKDNMLELSKTGRWLGGNVPLGYKSEPVPYASPDGKSKKMYKLVPVENEIEVIKLIYNMFLERKSPHAVARYLCENMYKGKNGGEFSRTTVEQIVKNPVYAVSNKKVVDFLKDHGVSFYGEPDNIHGIMTYNKRLNGKKEKAMNEWIASIGQHEGIISGDKWLKAQKIMDTFKSKNSNREGTSARALLSGLFICGVCGSGMGVTSKTKSSKTGKVEYYYRCNLRNRASSRCSNKNINGPHVDQLVIDYVKNIKTEYLIENYNNIKAEMSDSAVLYEEIQKLKETLDLNNKTIQGLIRKMALMDDSMIDMFKSEINKIRNENEEINKRIIENKQKISEGETIQETINEIVDRVDNFKNLIDSVTDMKDKRRLLKSVVEHVIWYSESETVEIDLIGSRRKVPKGIVNPRLRFGIGSRQNHAAGSKQQCRYRFLRS